MSYKEFPKIHRYSREVIVTEKLDGTNALIEIMPYADAAELSQYIVGALDLSGGHAAVLVGSRTRYIRPDDDNYGFANWVVKNLDELAKLGMGRHHGEWWGAGIQRKYNLPEKRFSLFNRARWADDSVRPACCHVVPEIWRGDFDELCLPALMQILERDGSKASPGFMKPEGIVIYHTHGNVMFKKTFEKDDHGKNYGA